MDIINLESKFQYKDIEKFKIDHEDEDYLKGISRRESLYNENNISFLNDSFGNLSVNKSIIQSSFDKMAKESQIEFKYSFDSIDKNKDGNKKSINAMKKREHKNINLMDNLSKNTKKM